ncbi:hypothetical protein F5Y08DRAFT_321264 [Xylaria arbuscula]|nr:hypothetical protein F5Y08DRAFT_321264 [Xylaria arbuscula]
MFYMRITIIAAATAVFMRGVRAGELEFVKEIQRDFHEGLFARQEQETLLAAASVTNLNTFTGTLGVAAAQITFSGDLERAYAIETFGDQQQSDPVPDFNTAFDKACDSQFQGCQAVANGPDKPFPVSDCDEQNTQCKESAGSAKQKKFVQQVESDNKTDNENFDFFCEAGNG